jgi:hypothetical protein
MTSSTLARFVYGLFVKRYKCHLECLVLQAFCFLILALFQLHDLFLQLLDFEAEGPIPFFDLKGVEYCGSFFQRL